MDNELCHCDDASDRHIAELAAEGDADSIEQLYPWAPINSAHIALLRCDRDGCPSHADGSHVWGLADLVGKVLERVESADE